MTCKDCVHYEVCKDKWSYELIPIFASLSGRMQKTYMDGMENKCQAFKPESRFVELPCEVGQTVYNLMGGFVEKQKVNRVVLILKQNEKHPLDYIKELDEIGKTVFFSREEAEKAVKERESE
jgi:hypothetical protein